MSVSNCYKARFDLKLGRVRRVTRVRVHTNQVDDDAWPLPLEELAPNENCQFELQVGNLSYRQNQYLGGKNIIFKKIMYQLL